LETARNQPLIQRKEAADLSNYTVAITGASGCIYGVRLVESLLPHCNELNLLISNNGKLVLREELNLDWTGSETQTNQKIQNYFKDKDNKIRYHDNNNFYAPIASGSSRNEAMILAPCSVGTLSRIAHGNSNTLIERAADVVLKEKRRMILVLRETPLNQIHLQNMLKLAQIGVQVMPACPAFYHKPKTIEDIVNFVVGRILDGLNIHNNLFERWSNS
jgi:4-hydroxy-3-polyprenylbenzoate decarboxylase